MIRDQEIDLLLLANISRQWRKVAFVVAVTMKQIHRIQPSGRDDLYFAGRIADLIENGLIESHGDPSRMRHSEIRLSPGAGVRDKLNEELKKARELALNYSDDVALAKYDRLLSENPGQPRILKERAWIYAGRKDYFRAIVDITAALAITPRDPGLYYVRGGWHFSIQNWQEAIDDQTRVIELEKELDHSYYLETAYFHRAVSLAQLDKFEEALSDCEHLDDDFITYLDGYEISKTDFVRWANENLPSEE